jgi:aspartate kinase
MKILVQKFGGSSVSSPNLLEMAAGKISEAITKGFTPVVVASAPGRKGSPYATDTLLSLAYEVSGVPDSRDLDLIASCGEIISCALLSITLKKKNIKSRAMTGVQAGIITDNRFGNASIKEINKSKIIDILKKGEVPIIAGFQGMTTHGDITTLGRGGSDTTAGALGYVLNAEAVEIYTDVDGIASVDPHIVSNSEIIKEMTYNEVLQMSKEGAKVIHPKTIEYAMIKNTPVYVKNTKNDHPGTKISLMASEESQFEWAKPRPVTAITYANNLTQIILGFKDMDNTFSKLGIFKSIGEKGICAYMINQNIDNISFVIKELDLGRVMEIIEGNDIKIKHMRQCSIVTLIGTGIRERQSIIPRIITTLSSKKIEIIQTTESHLTISCLINCDDINETVKTLYNEFYKKL